MIYVLGARAYLNYILDEDGKVKMTHEEVIEHINRSFMIRGQITQLNIVKDNE